MRYQHARRVRAFLNVALIATTAATCAGAHATDGALDTTFGTGGIALAGLTTVESEGLPHPLVQPDGKIVYCSPVNSGGTSGEDFVVLRFNADGSPDTDFSFDGKVTIDFEGGNDGCNAIVLQSDGKIVAVGSTLPTTAGANRDFAVARINPDGSLDPTFGAGTGKTTIAFDIADDKDDRARAVAVQVDGKIVVAGAATAGANYDYDFAIVRLSPDGTRDTTFNGTGRVTVAFDLPQSDHHADAAISVAVDSTGRVVVAGSAEASGTASDFAVARLLPNGQLDDEFDADGRSTIAFDLGGTTDDEASQALVQTDGRIVLVGYVDTGPGTTVNYDTALVRLLPDGSLDPGFGSGGKVVVPLDAGGPNYDYACGVVEDEAERLVVAGLASINDTEYGSMVMRFMSNGTIDPSFGTFGKTVISAAGASLNATGVALQGTQIIIGGGTYPDVGATYDNFVARLAVDLLFANAFE